MTERSLVAWGHEGKVLKIKDGGRYEVNNDMEGRWVMILTNKIGFK